MKIVYKCALNWLIISWLAFESGFSSNETNKQILDTHTHGGRWALTS